VEELGGGGGDGEESTAADATLYRGRGNGVAKEAPRAPNTRSTRL
jgi:hypothetical protein